MIYNPVLMLLYVAVSAVVGYIWRGRAIGFSGVFVLSLLISPVIMSLILLVTSPGRSESRG